MVVEQCQDNMSGFIHNRNNVHPTWRLLLDITTADTIRLINYHYIVSEEKPSLPFTRLVFLCKPGHLPELSLMQSHGSFVAFSSTHNGQPSSQTAQESKFKTIICAGLRGAMVTKTDVFSTAVIQVYIPGNEKQSPNAGLLLVHRLRQWTSIKPALGQHVATRTV